MMWSRPLLVTVLILLLQAFSFNAYACLLPMSPTTESADMRNCPSSQEQAPRQVCDAFKTMGVPTSLELNPAVDSHTLCPEDALSVAPTVQFPALIRSFADHPAVLPQEVLVDTIVLRL
ncbi:MAG: hypothetical protein M3Z35_15475 [Nitrospirota bacterium]|nr:hypothetical protein [Nitrospirota bacterium]